MLKQGIFKARILGTAAMAAGIGLPATVSRRARHAHVTARGQVARPRALRGSFLNETIDDLTVQYEENGQILINELDKVVLSKGAWTTILFRYQQWRPESDDYGPDKYVIRRYKKSGGEYRQQSKFTISSAEQARKIVDALRSWIEA